MLRGSQVPHGRWVACWNARQKKEVGSYRSGEKHGKWATWYENGTKLSEGHYANGERTARDELVSARVQGVRRALRQRKP